MNDNIVESDEWKSDGSCKFDEGQVTLAEDLCKFNEQQISPVLGKRSRRCPVNRYDDCLW
jgi:hypothetical protein